MMTSRGEAGRRGEQIAAAFLISKGFRVIAQNWRTKYGEIDLIVEKDGGIRFVEVKLRTSTRFGYPEESITPTKLSRLHRTIEIWLQRAPSVPKRYQLDAITIQMQENMPPDLRWIEGI